MKNYNLLFGLVTLLACKPDEEQIALPVPEITRIQPLAGFSGDTIRISGSRFQSVAGDNIVSFNGKVATVLNLEGDSVLQAIVPENGSTGPVSVANQAAAATGPVFTIFGNRNPPQLLSVSSENAETGEMLVITGKNFIPGADSSFNNVTIGTVKALVRSATDTQLMVLVPPGLSGSNLDVKVSIRGVSSDPLKINISGFAGTLFWTIIPGSNLPHDGFSQFVATARADGSTASLSSFIIPDDSLETKEILKFSLAGPKVFSVTQNALYYIRADRDTLLKVGNDQWNNFQPVFSGSETQGVGLNEVAALAMNEANQELFVSINSGVYKISGSNFSGFSFGGINKAEKLAFGDNTLYLIDRNATGEAYLKKIPSGGGAAELINTSSLPTLPPIIPGSSFARGILDIKYSQNTHSLYLVFEKAVDGPLELYQLDELTHTITLIAQNLPANGRFTLLDAPTGPKLYFLGNVATLFYGVEGFEALMMINLKPNARNEYFPVMLYKDLLKLPGRTTTFLTPYNVTNSYNTVDFLMVDDQ